MALDILEAKVAADECAVKASVSGHSSFSIFVYSYFLQKLGARPLVMRNLLLFYQGFGVAQVCLLLVLTPLMDLGLLFWHELDSSLFLSQLVRFLGEGWSQDLEAIYLQVKSYTLFYKSRKSAILYL